ncbi:hypothetical protein RB195_025698 [Necator americanus]|uniref:Uncharacterized protein n=1 Tax=Necator americanus TaxID=51031 RepID=A0ABR1ETG3_NECAM
MNHDLTTQLHATMNHELTSQLARRCGAIKEDVEDRRAAVLVKAGEVGKSIRYASRNFQIRKTKMTALRNQDGINTLSRKGMEKVIYDFWSSLRSPTRHHIGEQSYCTRSRQTQARTYEERLIASPNQHIGEAPHSLPVGMQSF